MNIKLNKFFVIALLSSTVHSMDITDPLTRLQNANKVTVSTRDPVDMRNLFSKIASKQKTKKDTENFLNDHELQNLFEQNIESHGPVISIFHYSNSLLKHHNEMVLLLESVQITPLSLNTSKIHEFQQLVDLMVDYTQRNGINKLAYLSSSDLMHLLKEPNISKNEKKYILGCNSSINERQRTVSNTTTMFSLHQQNINAIFSQVETNADKNTIIRVLARMLCMSRDYFLRTERIKANFFQNFIDELSNHLEETVTLNQDSIGALSIFHHLSKGLGYFETKNIFLSDKSEVLRHSSTISNFHLTNKLLGIQEELSSFYATFFNNIVTESALTPSMQTFLPVISFNENFLKSDNAIPLDTSNVSASSSDINRISQNYNTKILEKRKKRNKIFTASLLGDIVSLNYTQTREALKKLNLAYLQFEQQKIDLHRQYSEQILKLPSQNVTTPLDTLVSEIAPKESPSISTSMKLEDIPDISSEEQILNQPSIQQDPIKTPTRKKKKRCSTQIIPNPKMPAETVSNPDERCLKDIPDISSDQPSIQLETIEIPTIRKEKRWPTQNINNSKIPAETVSIANERYLYEDPSLWPDWIKTLKSERNFNITDVLKGFAQSFKRDGLEGIILELDNKYILRYLSPITNKFHSIKAHALHKGSNDKRYPAIRKALINSLEEGNIIPR